MGVLDRFRLDGKRLFITGGSRGLGREMARLLARAGASVAICSRTEAGVKAAAAELASARPVCGPLKPMPSNAPTNSRFNTMFATIAMIPMRTGVLVSWRAKKPGARTFTAMNAGKPSA